MARVTVVGAGVVGLSCAVRLLEAGHRVDVVARDLPLETTSAVAAAIWYPYRALPQDRVTAWARSTYAALEAVAAEPDAGVRMVDGTELHRRAAPDPWWAEAVPALAHETSLPPGYRDGWSFRAPVADMAVYLPWLAQRVEALGGTLTRLTLSGLPAPCSEEPGGPDAVVNCAGLGARLLGGDRSVAPVRGQVVHVTHPDGGRRRLDRWTIDPEGPTYVVPREDVVVLGGTADEGDWSRTPVPATAEEVLRRGRALVPELAGCRVVRHRVGLRPVRPAVRVERVGDVVHCYGHGGAGLTLSWGTADDVVAALSAG